MDIFTCPGGHSGIPAVYPEEEHADEGTSTLDY